MSRRARAVELWASLKYLGRRGIDDLVYGLHERAVQLGSELRAEGFEILNDIVFNQVLVACDNDAVTEKTIGNIQQSGDCWVGGAQWLERSVIRVSVCSWATTPDDISRSVKAFATARGEAR
jgi:glutamate/tyrosine decarboxylase-like PLP-dependent enzyme